MSRKNRTPEENERRAKILELLQLSGISSMNDIQNLFKETIAEFISIRRRRLCRTRGHSPGYFAAAIDGHWCSSLCRMRTSIKN